MLVFASAAVGLSSVAQAREKEKRVQPRAPQERMLVTSAYELDRLGLPQESTNVYQIRPGHYIIESRAESADPAPVFGNKNTDKYSVGWPAFDAEGDDVERYTELDSAERFTDYDYNYFAPVNLPTGAMVLGVETFYLDSHSTEELKTYFHQVCQTSSTPGTVTETSQLTAETGPANTATTPQYLPYTFAAPPQINNRDCHYAVRVKFGPLSDTTDGPFLYKMNVVWQRSVSPPPATPTFSDVPTTHPFYQSIEAMVASGVTGGCGGGKYCPDDPVNRGQMAAFMARFGGL